MTRAIVTPDRYLLSHLTPQRQPMVVLPPRDSHKIQVCCAGVRRQDRVTLHSPKNTVEFLCEKFGIVFPLSLAKSLSFGAQKWCYDLYCDAIVVR